MNKALSAHRIEMKRYAIIFSVILSAFCALGEEWDLRDDYARDNWNTYYWGKKI